MSIADELVEAFRPWMTADLEDYLRALASMFEEVESLGMPKGEDEAVPGWTAVFNVDTVPAGAVEYLANFLGEVMPKTVLGLGLEASRDWLRDSPNAKRGTVPAIVAAAQRYLTGQRAVSIRERTTSGGATNEDHLVVNTYTSETPDSNRVLQELLTTVPSDIVLTYAVLSGQLWSDTNTANATWTAVNTNNVSWERVFSTAPGNVFTDPL